MPPEYNIESTLLTLMFIIGMLVGSVITLIVSAYKNDRLKEQNRYSED